MVNSKQLMAESRHAGFTFLFAADYQPYTISYIEVAIN